MITRCLPALSIGLMALALVGCGLSREEQMARVKVSAAQGDFQLAASDLDALYDGSFDSGSASYKRKNGFLWSLERAQVAALAGDLQASNVLLEESKLMAEEYRSNWTSENAARTAGTIVANDTVARYEGNGFEHIQAWYLNALNYAMLGQVALGRYRPPMPSDGPAPWSEWTGSPIAALENALNIARGMTADELVDVEWQAGRQRYDDDPWARVMQAALTYAQEFKRSDDFQFAHVQLVKAHQAYAKQKQALSGQKHFRYETDAENQVATTLFYRNAINYFGGDLQQINRAAKEAGVPELTAEGVERWKLPDGHGMVLIANHADFIARPDRLEIRIVTATFPRFSLSNDEKKRGWRTAKFYIGGVAFWAKGPGADIVNAWGAFPVPGQVTEFIAPGGAAYMGFEIPVHPADQQNPPVASVSATSGADVVSADLQVVSDLDSYARATLKDDQPGVLTKTLLRAAAKQAAVAVASKAAADQNQLLGLATNLAGSALMTATENADIRAASLLPDRVEAIILDLPPGAHSLSLQSGGVVAELGDVQVEPGVLTLVPVRTFPNPEIDPYAP